MEQRSNAFHRHIMDYGESRARAVPGWSVRHGLRYDATSKLQQRAG